MGRRGQVGQDSGGAFYGELGEERCALLAAVSLDMGGAYEKATSAKAPQAHQCVDPFHLVQVRHEAPCNRGRVRDPPRRAVAAAR